MSRADAATVVFAYNRADLLRETLRCLERAGVSTLIAFSDGARGPGDEEAVREVRDVLRSIAWTDAEVVERPANVGLSASIVEGLRSVFEQHERAIVIEDDVAVAPEFGRFVTAALDHYEDDPAVAGVTGLRLPFSRRCLRGYPYDALTVPRFHSWGWATWRRAWEGFEFDRDVLRERLQAANARPELGGADLPELLREALDPAAPSGVWDVLCAANLIANGQVFVVPTWNMVDHLGWESGTHHAGPSRWKLRWEEEQRPDLERLRFPPAAPRAAILRSYGRFPEGPVARRLRQHTPMGARRLLLRLRGRAES